MNMLTFKVTQELFDWLEKEARELNRSKSEIVREALRAQRRRENAETAAARAGKLAGRFASGKKDSSHKRHLKGFGLHRRARKEM